MTRPCKARDKTQSNGGGGGGDDVSNHWQGAGAMQNMRKSRAGWRVTHQADMPGCAAQQLPSATTGKQVYLMQNDVSHTYTLQ